MSLIVRSLLTVALVPISAVHAASSESAPLIPDVPATNEWGMFIMVLLLMTASTAALYGGGALQRVFVDRLSDLWQREEREPTKVRVPKNRARRRLYRQAQRTRPGRAVNKSIRAIRRVSHTSQSKKRRFGPGIRD